MNDLLDVVQIEHGVWRCIFLDLHRLVCVVIHQERIFQLKDSIFPIVEESRMHGFFLHYRFGHSGNHLAVTDHVRM